MTVTVYRSTDAGAPTLNGVRGSLINVLSACLVDGYGSKTAAGWTKPYSITNVAAFKMPSGSNEHYLKVEEPDNFPYAWLQGFTGMTSITAGTGQFPGPMQNNATYPGKLFLYKTTYGFTSTTPVPWVLITNGNMMYFWCNTSITIPLNANTPCYAFCFGQIISNVQNDAYGTILIASGTQDAATCPLGQVSTAVNTGSITGHWIARNFTQTGVGYNVSKISDSAFMNGGSMGSQGLTFPNPADGKIYIAPVRIVEQVDANQTVFRGTLPGLYAPLFRAVNNLNDGDQISNVEGYSGKVFEVHLLYSDMVALFEISNTW